MSYFDSPKNRAMWEKEMTGLRAERELRKNAGCELPDDRQNSMAQAAEDTAERDVISFWELQQEE